MTSRLVSWSAGLALLATTGTATTATTAKAAAKAATKAATPATAMQVRSLDPAGVYAMIERLQFEPATGTAERVQVWGVFAFADAKSADGYGAVQRGYLYFACPAGHAVTCRDDWEDFRWFSGTGKGVGFGLRSAAIGRLRKDGEPPASPDPYPVRGGIVKVESKDPAYVDLVARLKAALK